MGYLLAFPSEDCQTTPTNVYGSYSLNIDYVPDDLFCVVSLNNWGSYSSSLRFIEDDYHNVEAHVFESNIFSSYYEPRGHFSTDEADESSKKENDFHIWYTNSSIVVLNVKDPNAGPGVFKAKVKPLTAPEKDITTMVKTLRLNFNKKWLQHYLQIS